MSEKFWEVKLYGLGEILVLPMPENVGDRGLLPLSASMFALPYGFDVLARKEAASGDMLLRSTMLSISS